MEQFENCYRVEYKQQIIYCHFNEISYFSVNSYQPEGLILYTPHLKNGETLVSDTGESGRQQFINYLNYVNNK